MKYVPEPETSFPYVRVSLCVFCFSPPGPSHGGLQKWLLCAPVGLYNVFNSPPADRTAGVGHLFEAQAAAVAQAHVTTRIDNRVHCVLIADGALIQPGAGG